LAASDIINSAGVAIILAAYALNTMGRLNNAPSLYHAMNLVGGALACVGSYLISAYPFVVLEGVWSLVALAALLGRTKK